LEKCHRHAERAFALCRDISSEELISAYGVDWWLAPPLFLAVVEVLLGRPTQGAHWEKLVVERAESNSHPFSKALGLCFVALSAQVRGDPTAASAHLAPVRQISEECGLSECKGWAKLFKRLGSLLAGRKGAGNGRDERSDRGVACRGQFLDIEMAARPSERGA